MISAKKQDQSSDDDQTNQKNNLLYNQQKKIISKFSHKLKLSPYIKQYKEKFLRGRKVENFKEYWKNFNIHEIIFFQQLGQPVPVSIQMPSESRNFRIIHYEVKLSLFSLKIKILNITKEDNFIFQFQREINKGMFGTVYQARENNKYSAVKELQFGSDSVTTIELAVKEYAIMKLLAALECGPAINKLFGFDLVISDKCIYFESEYCLSVEEYLSQIENQAHFLKDFEKLQESLLEMHSLNICHIDIKPCNILYSLSLRKLVFVDFGFSEVKSEPLGFMKEEKAKGSFYYSCEDMKNLFISSKQKGYVDNYYNDFYGLMKSKQMILSMIKNSKFSIIKHKNSREEVIGQQFLHIKSRSLDVFQSELDSVQKQTNSFDKLFTTSIDSSSYESDYLIVLIIYLLSECRIIEIENLIRKNSSVKKKLESKLLRYYWVFLQIKVNISVENTYKRLKSIILQNSQISFQTKKIIENVLDPHFQRVLKGDLQTNEPYLNYMKKQHKNRTMFRQRLNINSQSSGFFIRFDHFGKKSSYQFFQQIPQQLKILNEESQTNFKNNTNFDVSPHNLTKENLKDKFQLSKLSDNKRLQIINRFLSMKQSKLSLIIEKFYFRFTLNKTDNNFYRYNIQVFKDCFKKAEIEINYQDLEGKQISQQEYFVICINLLTEIIIEFIKSYMIQKSVIFIFQESPNKQDEIFSLLKNDLFSRNLSIDVNKYKNQIGKDYKKFKYLTLKNFQRILLIFFKIEPLFSDSNSYSYSKQKIDSLVENLYHKMILTLELHEKLYKKIKKHEICSILNTLFQQLMVFIYEIGTNAFAKAQINEDIQRLSFYFQKIFSFDHIFEKFPKKRHIIQRIIRFHAIFYYTKDVCCLMIYRSVLPRSLCEKYHILEKIEKFISITNYKHFQIDSQHVKLIRDNLFWQHFNQLKNQSDHDKTLVKIDEMFAVGQRIWDEEMIRIFRYVYKVVNNNKKKKQMQNRISYHFFDPFACDNNSSTSQVIKSFKIPIKEFEVNLENQQQLKSTKKINQKNQSSIILQQITYFLNLEQNEMSFNQKWYYIRQLINRSLNTYPNQDINLQYYIQKYQESLEEYESYQKRKIQVYRKLPLKVSIYQFLTFSKKTKNNQDTQDWQSLQKQEQFWKEIYFETILEQHFLFLFLFINNQKKIKDKNLILSVCQKSITKIQNIFQGKQNDSLSFLELFSCIKQFIYNQKVLKNFETFVNQQEIQKAKFQFFNSIGLFLSKCTPQNPQFIFKIKTSQFYLDSLLKIYNESIKIEDFQREKAKESLIKLFDILVENSQIYSFFREDHIYEQFLKYMLLFGLEQVKQCIDYKLNQREMNKTQMQINNMKLIRSDDMKLFQQEMQNQFINQYFKNRNKQQMILQKVFVTIGTFAQKYKCRNYSKVIMKISTQFCQHLVSIFVQLRQRNYLTLQQSITITIQIILNNILLKIIKQRSSNQLILVYLVALNNLVYQFIAKRNQQNSYQSLLQTFKKCLKDIITVSFERMEFTVRMYSFQLINSILIKTTLSSQKHLYYQIKYFRSFLNSKLDQKNKILYFDQSSIKDPQHSLVGIKTFQKIFKKSLYGLIVEKSSLNLSSTIFLQKINQKIIRRLNISVCQ